MLRSRKRLFTIGGVALVLLTGGVPRLLGYAVQSQKPWPSGTTIKMELQLGDSPAPAISGSLSDGSTSWNQVALAALSDWNQYLASVQMSGAMNSTAPKGEQNGYNNVFFSSTVYGDSWGGDTIGETLIWIRSSDNTPTEADVVFNTAETWDSYRGPLKADGALDLKRVALHEFGHVLGLDHPDSAGQTVSAVMNSRISNTDDLTADDIAGVESLYGTNITPKAPQILLQPASQTVNAGDSVTFTVSATGTAPVSYQWQKNGANISYATSSTYTISSTQTSDAGNYTVVVANTVGSVTSSVAALTVNPPPLPVISTQPQDKTAYVGQWVTFSVSVSSKVPVTYQWQKNGANIVNTNNASFYLYNVQLTDAGSYGVVVINSTGSTTSDAATLTVNPALPPQITTQPQSQTVYAGQNASFNANFSSTISMTFQWQKDGEDISGATSSYFSLSSVRASDAGNYTLVATNSSGSTATNAAVLTVNPAIAPQITTQPQGQVVAAGASVGLTVSNTGSLPLTYQWRRNGINLGNANSSGLYFSSIRTGDAGNYSVTITNAAGSVTSQTVTVGVNGPAPQYILTDIGTLGGNGSTATGINNLGQVVGYGKTKSNNTHAFLYNDGVMQDLEVLGSSSLNNYSMAAAINDVGQIVGASSTSSDNYTEDIFLYSNGAMRDLGALPPNGTVSGLNSSGQICGTGSTEAFLYQNGTQQALGALGTYPVSQANGIGNSGQIVGFSYVQVSDTLWPRAFLYSNGTMQDLGVLLGGITSEATAINSSNQIVGYSALSGNVSTHAFLYTDGVAQDLGTLPKGSESEAYALNAAGQVVGQADNAAFIYKSTLGMANLNGMVPLVSFGPGFTSLNIATGINDAGQIVGNGNYADTIGNQQTHAFLLTPVNAIRVQPAAAMVAAGQTAVFNVGATGTGYQWTHNGSLIAGATGPTLVLSNVATADAGAYACTVTNGSNSTTSIGSLLTVNNAADIGHLTNLSIRSNAGSGDQTLIAGFVVGGTGGEPLLIRATGPALTAFGVTGVLADPVLNIYQNSKVVASNDNWGGNAQITSIGNALGAFPLTDANSLDAALYENALPAGAYTAQITGNNGGTGITLGEVYDASTSAYTTGAPHLTNISARTQVGTGANILIAGFVIGGSTAKTVLIRATGPALTQFGVNGVLADPVLQLYQGSTLIATNDNWGGNAQITAISKQVGAFALTDPNSKDAALLVTLQPGVYTAQVSGANGGTGVALVEVYDVP